MIDFWIALITALIMDSVVNVFSSLVQYVCGCRLYCPREQVREPLYVKIPSF
jgi:hypothetical protein